MHIRLDPRDCAVFRNPSHGGRQDLRLRGADARDWPYKENFHGFRFVSDGGEPVNIETEIILPCWAGPAIFDGRTFRVVYLQDSKRIVKNEAIHIEILSGKDAGFYDSYAALKLPFCIECHGGTV